MQFANLLGTRDNENSDAKLDFIRFESVSAIHRLRMSVIITYDTY